DDSVTGFLFDAFEERAAAGAVWRALTEMRSPKAWQEMQREAMSRDFGWDRVAEKYLSIYTDAISHRARHSA
ncbi:MAG TPA: hypothetical protein PLJ23_12360, partial [Gemmatimonadales bacterium]|nr:hypothetical protein [Gemmatimonadales bacterium]